MEKKPISLREKMAELRGHFLDRLPQNLADARRFAGILTAAPSDVAALDELFRACHSIKGTARSFGLAQIGEQAAIAEQALTVLREVEPSGREPLLPGILPAVERHLKTIEKLSASARHIETHEIPAEIAPAIDIETGPPPQDQKRIFVCDDDIQAEALAAQLSAFGYDVQIFHDRESLRDAVRDSPPSAIVMDIVFPGNSAGGTDLVAALRAEIPWTPPVVFLSGRQDFDARFRAVRAGGAAYFTKPIRGAELVETLDILTRAHDPEPYRILVVDDEPDIAAYHSFILEQHGMITRLLHEPQRILEILGEFKPDLVLMDVHMPHCNGRDLARVIRQVPEFVGLPIVFLSSETDKKEQISALQVGAEGFLTKPIAPDDLIFAVALRAERMRTLRSLMVRDSLTGLFNHTFITQFLASAVASAARRQGSVCVAMIDVDLFKSVNDGFGHPAGDQVLVTLARLLQRRLRGADMVGRYGGEEFGIVLNDVGLQEGIELVDGLRKSFAKIRFHFDRQEIGCTFSAGVAAFPLYRSPEHLIDAADKALYQAKRAGRNRVIGGDPGLRS